uniref:Coiled-coil domain containing 157 n=1 Tax=Apteryx owenii TaxID=8824 RepID=A0A8B9Q568_APTOW
MAHLLGSPTCMDSLRADITDLQGAIADVFSRAGAVRYPSWKFPDKVSCELDLAELLEHYDYVENDLEFTQHSHVVLLELVIDRRLLLLLQSFTGYAENLLSEKAIPPARPVGPCMSAGLTVRKYWNSMLKLGALYQQLLTEVGYTGTLKCCELRARLTKMTLASTLRNSEAASGLHTVISTQTTESSLVPCDSCASAQASLREVSKAITSICQSQNIPSALSRFHETLEETMGRRTLSVMGMSYWASEQSKDLSRISKHLNMLLQLINPLKSKLEEAEKQKDELRKQVEEFAKLLQEEKESQEQQRKEAEQTMEAKKKECLETVVKLERDKEDLRREMTKKTLLEDMRTKMVAKSEMLELEEKVQLLTGQQEGMGQELSAITTQLEKEKAKVESMLRHEESLQAKQRALLQQLDSLDQECEELRGSLGEAEEDKARLAEQLKESQEKWEQSKCQLEVQQKLLDTLQREKLGLEQSISELRTNVSGLEELVQELKERERLLVSFPELHVPVETQFESKGEEGVEGSRQDCIWFAGTGSFTEDMEKQLQANSIRLSILEQENARLRAALAKVKAAAQQGVLKVRLHPTQGAPESNGVSRNPKKGAVELPSSSSLPPSYAPSPCRPPSSQGSRDGAGAHRSTGKTHRRPPSSQPTKPLSADPTRKAGPCLSLPAEGLVLGTHSEPRGRGSAARAYSLFSHSTRSHQK